MYLIKLKKDFSGYLFKAIRKWFLFINKSYFTFYIRILLVLKGIKFGENICFRGETIFFRCPESKIVIGANCSFVSDSHFNLAGINRKCTISTLYKNAILKIGNKCGISGAVISAKTSLIIGNNVNIGANSFISDHDWHNITPNERRSECYSSKPIVIEDNVWLGLNVIVLKGTTIGKNSVIGANSVVTKDIPANVIAAGNPCRVIRNI